MTEKTKRIVGIILLMCCMLVILTACSGGLEKNILGSWAAAGDDEYITFYSSGTLILAPSGEDSIEGTWSVSDKNMLTISYDDEEFTVEVTDISSDSMTWEIDGQSVELLKRG